MKPALSRSRACIGAAWVVLFALALPVQATPAQDAADAERRVAADPAGAWDDFIANAEYADAYSAYDVLSEIGYSHAAVDAAACKAQREALDAAVVAAPVSIIVHRARMLCAEALGEDARAEAALAALGALSKLALADGHEAFAPRPIRVLGPMDVYALLASSGLAYRYDYFPNLRTERHFPLVVAAWDEESGKERHLAFDYIDVVHAIDRDDSYSGFPVQRQLLAEAFIESQAKAGEAQAIDWQAIDAARRTGDAREKVAKLRAAAEGGGLQSATAWLVVCARTPYPGCGDGLVDALLPQAEKEHAAFTTLLALAHAVGAGIDKDAAAAATLLDTANRRWHDDGAIVFFAWTWGALDAGQAPEFLQQRMAQAVARGNVVVPLITASWKLYGGEEGKPQLTAAETKALADAANNRTGHGYAMLADYHHRREEIPVSDAWSAKAAEAGNAGSQAGTGVAAFGRARNRAQRDEALRMVARGAQGGNGFGMRFMAYQSTRAEQWADAEAWLMDAARRGEIDAMLDLSDIYERERPGIRGEQQQAIDTYRALADEDDNAEARRRLAAMALEGRGIDKDPAQAERWLLQDAEKGDGASAALLAYAYLEGEIGERDKAKGVAWMERAIAAGQTEAYSDYGSWYFYLDGNTLPSRLRGIEIWQKGVEAGARMALNNLAWARCTAPEAEIFDPVKGLAEAEKIMAWDEVPAGVLDTVAACHAAAGDYAKAAELQDAAIAQLTSQEAEADRKRDDNFFSRLALYRAGKRYVEAHRDGRDEDEAQ